MKKIKFTFFLVVSLALTACATNMSTTEFNQTTNNDLYSFPKDIENGYWAMVGDIFGEYIVVDFKGDITNNYRFKCDDSTHTYRQVGKETYTLKPTTDSMQLIHAGSAFTMLKVIQFEPKKVLLLNQLPSDVEGREVLPNGIELAYIHSATLKPLCGS